MQRSSKLQFDTACGNVKLWSINNNNNVYFDTDVTFKTINIF